MVYRLAMRFTATRELQGGADIWMGGTSSFEFITRGMHVQRCFHPDTLLELDLQIQQLLDLPLRSRARQPLVVHLPAQTPAQVSGRT